MSALENLIKDGKIYCILCKNNVLCKNIAKHVQKVHPDVGNKCFLLKKRKNKSQKKRCADFNDIKIDLSDLNDDNHHDEALYCKIELLTEQVKSLNKEIVLLHELRLKDTELYEQCKLLHQRERDISLLNSMNRTLCAEKSTYLKLNDNFSK